VIGSLPGSRFREVTEAANVELKIAQVYGSERNGTAPLIPVVTLPADKTVRSPGVSAQLSRFDERLRAALPGARLASLDPIALGGRRHAPTASSYLPPALVD
jgi:hypothetical protein